MSQDPARQYVEARTEEFRAKKNLCQFAIDMAAVVEFLQADPPGLRGAAGSERQVLEIKDRLGRLPEKKAVHDEIERYRQAFVRRMNALESLPANEREAIEADTK